MLDRVEPGEMLVPYSDADIAAEFDATVAFGRPPGTADAVAGAWFSVFEAIRGFDSDEPMSRRRLAQFRQAAVESASRILTPTAVAAPLD